MAMDYTPTSGGTTEERLARIEAQNEVIIHALQKKKKNVVFVSSSLSFLLLSMSSFYLVELISTEHSV